MTKWQQEKPKQHLMKTSNVSKTKPNETKAWLRSPFMLSNHEMDRAYSPANTSVTADSMADNSK